MARKVNFVKRGEKIKEQIDELISDLQEELKSNDAGEESVDKRVKISEIDFENEDITTLMKIQTRLIRIIQNRIRG